MSAITHSVSMRLTADSANCVFVILNVFCILKYRGIQYSDGAAGGARARALAGQGREEGAHGGRRCGRAAWNPMLSAHLRIAGDLALKDHPSLPTPASRGRCARDPSASVKERESGKCDIRQKAFCLMSGRPALRRA